MSLITLFGYFFNYYADFTERIFKIGERRYHCIFTKNKSDIHNADAVVFHHRNIVVNDLPTCKNPGQKWVFYTKVIGILFMFFTHTLGSYNSVELCFHLSSYLKNIVYEC